MENKKKILIDEDELISSEYLKEVLLLEGYEVFEVVDTGSEAIKQSKILNPDLILMDIMLKDNISGCEAAVQIHQNLPGIKFIFLTAYSEKEMIDYAANASASAYLLKPYREHEIIATIQLLFAHTSPHPEIDEETITLKNGYTFNTKLRRLFKEDKEVSLGKKPLQLIEILVKNKNVSVSNEQICTFIWGEHKNDRTLRSLIHRIRSSIHPDLIQNINGLGYKIA